MSRRWCRGVHRVTFTATVSTGRSVATQGTRERRYRTPDPAPPYSLGTEDHNAALRVAVLHRLAAPPYSCS